MTGIEIAIERMHELVTENAALKEQITNAKYNYLGAMADCKRYEETIEQQAEAIEKLRDHIELSLEFCDEEGFCIRDNLENALAIQPSPEILQNAGRLMFELQSVTEQQAEAIRVKDESLFAACSTFAEYAQIHANKSPPDIQKTEFNAERANQMNVALAIQPSPDILQARDDRVAAACAEMLRNKELPFEIDAWVEATKRDVSSMTALALAALVDSGEWRKYL